MDPTTETTTKSRLFVIVPVYNRRTITLTCVDKLLCQTRKPDEIVVADGGSNDGTPEEVSCLFPEVTVLRCGRDKFWGETMVAGIDHVLSREPDDDDVLVMMNDDTDFPTNYLEVMERICRRESSAIGAVIIDADDHARILNAGVSIDWANYRFPAQISRPASATLRDVDVLPGRGSTVPIGMIRATGNVDAVNFPHYLADYDFFYRVKKAGFRLGVTGDTWLASNTRTTGLSQTAMPRGIRAAWQLAFSRRSMDNLGDHLHFARRHAPAGAGRIRIYFLLIIRRISYLFPEKITRNLKSLVAKLRHFNIHPQGADR